MTLKDLPPGRKGEIIAVRGLPRLAEMGLVPGTLVTVRKLAPLGDPMQLTLRGYELALRKADAAKIEVRPR